MPIWSHDIPDDPRGPAFPIHRTPAYKPLQAIATSDDLLGTFTHFYKGRTMPHEETNCEACEAGMPYVWHAYLSAFNQQTSLHFIFEMTAQAANAFIEYRTSFHTLRGCHFEARRMNNKPNGRILIRTKPYDLSTIVLPKPPDLIKCLSILWSLPTNTLSAATTNPDKQTKQVRRRAAPK